MTVDGGGAMVVHIEQAHSDLSISETWRRVADPRLIPTWDPGILAVVPIEAGPATVGSRYRVMLRVGAVAVPVTFKILALEPPHRIVLASEGRWLAAVDDVLVEPHGAGARVTWRAELQLHGPLSITGRLWQRSFDAYARRAIDGLRAWLAKEAQADALIPERT
jgi:carbon monoxide dehydrogenase subunit G